MNMEKEKEEWILSELERTLEKTADETLRVLIKAAQGIIKEQSRRMEQMEAEIDGTLWSPRRWGE
jgi:hypothetical protein